MLSTQAIWRAAGQKWRTCWPVALLVSATVAFSVAVFGWWQGQNLNWLNLTRWHLFFRLVYHLLAGGIMYLLYLVFWRLSQNRRVTWSLLAEARSRFGWALLFYLSQWVLFLSPIALALVVGWSLNEIIEILFAPPLLIRVRLVCWAIVGVLGLVFFGRQIIRYGLGWFTLVSDSDLSPWTALKRSRRLTSGYGCQFLQLNSLFLLALLVWVAADYFLSGLIVDPNLSRLVFSFLGSLGLAVLISYFLLVNAIFYQQLLKEKEPE